MHSYKIVLSFKAYLDSINTGSNFYYKFLNIHKEGNTLIVVTHEQEVANHSKRIIRLKDGKIESDKPNNH